MSMTELDMSKAATLRSWFYSAHSLNSPMPLSLRKTDVPDVAPVATGIKLEDWDLLFRAVLETFARVASERTLPDGMVLRLQTPSEVIDGCLEALDQLRRSMPVVQHPWMLMGSVSAANASN